MEKIFVFGLDCATPQHLFGPWLDELPNFRRLAATGLAGPLVSCLPPITVPAWSCLLTGRDPGELGFYGFRNRADYSYQALTFATADAVRAPRLWDRVGEAGGRSILIGVPQTYPPPAVNGLVIADFLAPDTDCEFTRPAGLKNRLKDWVGEYLLDVENFRSEDKENLKRQIWTMTERRLAVAERLLEKEPWDFFMLVEMGLDRLYHGFWKFFDPEHRKHRPGNPFQDIARDYYRLVDRGLGRLLELAGDALVLVVSDHGARALDGCVCVNEWLIEKGYLALRGEPARPVHPRQVGYDWSRTRAWAEGGYYARIFLNVRGREPEGIVEPADYEALRDELIAGLEALGDERGRPIGTRVYRPETLYRAVRGVPPDLIGIFGELAWRPLATVGHRRVHTFENDTGPDDANHDQKGIYILNDPAGRLPRGRRELSIYDLAPTILARAGLKVPAGLRGVAALE